MPSTHASNASNVSSPISASRPQRRCRGAHELQIQQHVVEHVRLHHHEQSGRLFDCPGHADQARRHGHRVPVDDPDRCQGQRGVQLRRARRGSGLPRGRVHPGQLRRGDVHPLRAHDQPRRPHPVFRQPRGRRRVPRLRSSAGLREGRPAVYEKDGERYFIVDGHIHFWDGSPQNQANKYGKGFIECFYDYHRNLSPPEWVWPLDKFEKYTEQDLMTDVFDDGYVDVGIFQPTYLTDFYTKGFNTTEDDGAIAEKHPGKFVVNGSFDPRAGEPGLEEFEALVARWGLKGVKLYTAEWRGGARRGNASPPPARRLAERSGRRAGPDIHPPNGPPTPPLQ